MLDKRIRWFISTSVVYFSTYPKWFQEYNELNWVSAPRWLPFPSNEYPLASGPNIFHRKRQRNLKRIKIVKYRFTLFLLSSLPVSERSPFVLKKLIDCPFWFWSHSKLYDARTVYTVINVNKLANRILSTKENSVNIFSDIKQFYGKLKIISQYYCTRDNLDISHTHRYLFSNNKRVIFEFFNNEIICTGNRVFCIWSNVQYILLFLNMFINYHELTVIVTLNCIQLKSINTLLFTT